MQTRLGTVLVVLAVALAGCTAGTAPTGGDGASGGSPAASPADVARDTDGGAVNFWISDERNDIDDFEHLNVTVTRVAFQRAGGNDTDGEDAAGKDADGNETGDWIEREVDDRTVDLTRLKGANATLIGSFDVPDGNYTKVFVYVDGINATLKDGGSTKVKLPSGRLHLNEGFEVTTNSSPDFVFDISVHKAGKSGKYILKPVVSQSGADVPIEDADGGGPPDDVPGKGDDRRGGKGKDKDRGNGNGPPDDVPGKGDEKREEAGEGGNGPPDDAPGKGDDEADEADEGDEADEADEGDEADEEDEDGGDDGAGDGGDGGAGAGGDGGDGGDGGA